MRKGGVLKISAQVVDCGDRIEIAIQPQNVQNGGVCAEGDAHPAMLDISERHRGHSGSLRNELC